MSEKVSQFRSNAGEALTQAAGLRAALADLNARRAARASHVAALRARAERDGLIQPSGGAGTPVQEG
jgi:hypothetical protein